MYNLAQELSNFHSITIVSPVKFHTILRKKKFYGYENCKIFRPTYLSFSNWNIMGLDFAKISFRALRFAVKRVLNSKIDRPDLIYTHFFINALTVDDYAERNNIPLIVASGESNYNPLLGFGKSRLNKLVNRIERTIAVSEINRKFSLDLGIREENIVLVPNAVDTNVFFPMDKIKCKRNLGFSSTNFVVGFIGHFIPRKGLLRLIKALDLIQDCSIRLVCIGEGDYFEDRSYIKFIPPMANSLLPNIINSFDIFVLPTLSEGHCNAIEEVKACGVPVISSKGTSVENQIDESNGILVDPENSIEISIAIRSLLSDKNKRERMRDNLIRQRVGNPLVLRAKAISNIFDQTLKEYDLQN